MKVDGYNYELLVLRTSARWPRMRCWVCEALLPAIAEGGVDLGPVALSVRQEVGRCDEVSGPAFPDAHHLLSKQKIKDAFPHGAILAAPVDVEALRADSPRWMAWDPRMPLIGGETEFQRRSLGDLLMDDRNCVPVRRFHHDALERGLLAGRPLDVPFGLLPPAAVEFASEFDLLSQLEAVYKKESVR